MCRVYGKTVESVEHLATGCSLLVQKEYQRSCNCTGLLYMEKCIKADMKGLWKYIKEKENEGSTWKEACKRKYPTKT